MTVEALEILNNTHEVAKTYQNHSLLERTLSAFGVTHLNMGNFAQAIAAFNEVLEIAKLRKKTDSQFIALYNLGSAYSIQEALETALTYFQEAYAIARHENSHDKQAAVLAVIAGIAVKLKNYDFAREQLLLVESLIQNHNVETSVNFLRTWGYFQRSQGDLVSAIGYMEQAVNLGKARNDWYGTRFSLQELSELYEESGDYQNALRMMRELHQLTLKTNSEQVQARVQTLQALHERKTLQMRSEAAERELTAYKQAEAERREKERLQTTLQHEQEFAQSKQRILTRLNHELRTPLTIVYNSANILSHYFDKLSQN
ncbi:MAG: tetratricopeptide repeat protein [Leptolyngbyaceae cyanobacterium SM1_4_3]|nr:tetratricopeptide repeat protein [Leptolyngbyaceae cyanobacterium SM1_4_3]